MLHPNYENIVLHLAEACAEGWRTRRSPCTKVRAPLKGRRKKKKNRTLRL